jgi:hypothetical protein
LNCRKVASSWAACARRAGGRFILCESGGGAGGGSESAVSTALRAQAGFWRTPGRQEAGAGRGSPCQRAGCSWYQRPPPSAGHRAPGPPARAGSHGGAGCGPASQPPPTASQPQATSQGVGVRVPPSPARSRPPTSCSSPAMPGWQANSRRPTATSRRYTAVAPPAAARLRQGAPRATAHASASWSQRLAGRSWSPWRGGRRAPLLRCGVGVGVWGAARAAATSQARRSRPAPSGGGPKAPLSGRQAPGALYS